MTTPKCKNTSSLKRLFLSRETHSNNPMYKMFGLRRPDMETSMWSCPQSVSHPIDIGACTISHLYQFRRYAQISSTERRSDYTRKPRHTMLFEPHLHHSSYRNPENHRNILLGPYTRISRKPASPLETRLWVPTHRSSQGQIGDGAGDCSLRWLGLEHQG